MILPIGKTNGDVSVDGEDSRNDDGEEEGRRQTLRGRGKEANDAISLGLLLHKLRSERNTTYDVLRSRTIVQSSHERLKDKEGRQNSEEQSRTEEQDWHSSENSEIPLPPNSPSSSRRALSSPLLLALDSLHPPLRRERLLLDPPSLDDSDTPEASDESVGRRVRSSG